LGLQRVAETCSKLRAFRIVGSDSLTEFAPFQTLSELQQLTISPSNNGPRNLEFLESMPKLKSLALSAYEVSLDPGPLATLHELRRLDLEGVRRLPDFEVLSRMEHLQTLRLSDCRIESFSKVDRLKGLTTLAFFCKLPSIDFLASLPRLVYLTLGDTRCKKLDLLGEHSRLSHVTLMSCKVKDISSLASCNKLRELNLASYDEHSAIQQFLDCLGENSRSSRLTTLQLPCYGDVFDISGLGSLKQLRSLSLTVTGTVPAMLQALRQLKMLAIFGHHEADALPQMDRLDNLIVLDCSMEELDSDELQQVARLQKLRCLQLSGCTSLPGNTPIGQLTNLESLSISHSSVRGLDFIRKLKNLRSLSFDECDLPSDVGVLAEAMATGVDVELDDWELLDKIKARAAQLGKTPE